MEDLPGTVGETSFDCPRRASEKWQQQNPQSHGCPRGQKAVSPVSQELRALGLLTQENGLLWGWPLFCEAAATLIDLCSFSRQ